ncbi:MAG: ABC transporter substrate-binding protein [Verrucomicrobiaceae bacterium]|nr:ABC transporter substrate-binding protein [Verrucomicrobiaceae bacterium]
MIELPWSSAVMRALGNGAADAAVVTLDAVLRMREGGQDLRVLMVLDESTGADVVLAREDIRDIRGLKGRRVGVDVRGTGAYLLFCALESAGMAMNDVNVVQLTQPEMVDAVAQGIVDAVVASEPWIGRLKVTGLRGIFDSRQLSVPIMRVLVASAEACEQFQPQLASLIRAQVEWTARVRSGKPFEGVETVLRREKRDLKSLVEGFDLWRPLNLARNRELLAGERPELAVLAGRLTEMMLRAGLLKSSPADEPWIDATIIEEVLP